MFVDALQLLSDAQALTATAYSTNTIDFGNVSPARDVGAGEPMEITLEVDVAADGTTTDETYEFQVVQSANANLSSHDVLASRTITYANLTLGSIHRLPVPAGAITKRYFGLRAVLGGTTPTITVTAHLQTASMAAVAKPITYAKGYTVS